MEREVSAEPVSEGTLLWQPSEEQKAQANITRYLRWLREQKGIDFAPYEDLWAWSVTDLEGFWASVWDFFGVKAHQPYTRVLPERGMPGTRWFAGAELNYAEHALQRCDDHAAVVFKSEMEPLRTLTYAELHRQVAAVAAGLRRLGVQRGDRVAAYMPNIPQTVVAFLAVASIGAIWSSCSPDFGARAVVDRFRMIAPKVLLAADGYQYNGTPYERLAAVAQIQQHLPTLDATVVVPHLSERPATEGLANAMLWDDLISGRAELSFEPVPFEHPLWVLYSSGTTGPPKAIVQGHGGILLEHLKALSLHLDLTAEDRFFWFTTTGWMMWNFLISGLLLGMTVLLYDGSPGYPDMRALWQFAEEAGMTYFGTSAPYILACMKAGIEPGQEFDLGALRGVGSTGAPLPPEGFRWVYDKVKRDLLLGSVSGGTDVCTAFVLSCPTLPVHAGEIQCRGLGARVEAFDEQGRPVVDEVGELVITEPLPSMPLFFWNDPDNRRYHESYFDMFPGVWRHGDWIKVTRRGSCVIYGRSDSTLNRAGVRMGSSEFYRVVEELPEVVDSLIVDTGQLGREGRLLLFVVLASGVSLDEELRERIRDKLRRELSPRYVPDEMYAVADIPRTLNAKKLEVPVKRILTGTPPEKAVSPDAISNPQAMHFFIDLARSLQQAGG
ncbi:MAG: acetoacetate--CoA ligase [Dehalococcoidia bacterium]